MSPEQWHWLWGLLLEIHPARPLERPQNWRLLAPSPSSGTVKVAEVSVAKKGNLWKILVPVLMAAALIAGGLYYRLHQSKLLTDKDTIVLSDFDNKTGDPVFDDTLKQRSLSAA
jgi:hypothetical protein